jgi:hypothetical protein
MTEIEVEGVGIYRLPNDWQYGRLGQRGARSAILQSWASVRHDRPPVLKNCPWTGSRRFTGRILR